MENVKYFPNFQTGIDFQFQNPKPITPTIFNQPTIISMVEQLHTSCSHLYIMLRIPI